MKYIRFIIIYCFFISSFIIEVPKPPRDCLLINDSSTIYTVICETSSKSESLNVENYVLEIYESQDGPLIQRFQEMKPRFRIILDDSKDIDEFFLKVYATSSIGRSNYVNLTLKNERQLKLNQAPNNVSLLGKCKSI